MRLLTFYLFANNKNQIFKFDRYMIVLEEDEGVRCDYDDEMSRDQATLAIRDVVLLDYEFINDILCTSVDI